MPLSSKRVALVTGGAGFIGCNLAEQLLRDSTLRVRVFDNLSRTGVQRNLAWLQSLEAANRLEFVEADIRDAIAVTAAMRDVTEVYHLAAQVAVTTSVTNPRQDFEVNALGTLNVLEAARDSSLRPSLLFTSTNKVYGSLEQLRCEVKKNAYRACDPAFDGVAEEEPLDFHSPYGCSKGAADQYMRDYARIYGMGATVFRMSCIAGPHQFGNEDQGWVAHFLYRILAGQAVTIYGDGYQVRDVLHVQDLVRAMMVVRQAGERCHGQIYNVGGGMDRSVSVIEMLRMIERETGQALHLNYSDMRPGDQPLYITNTAKLQRDVGWAPRFSVLETLRAIAEFWQENSSVGESGARALQEEMA